MKVSTENIIKEQQYLMELSAMGGIKSPVVTNRAVSAGGANVYTKPNQLPKAHVNQFARPRLRNQNTAAVKVIPAQKTSWSSKGA